MPTIRYLGGISSSLPSLSDGLPGVGFAPSPTFFAPLTTSLVPAACSGTPTFTRATTATVSAVAADGNAVDGEVIIMCAAGEARFQGARRVSEGVWSQYYADGTPIPDANLRGYLSENARTNFCLYSQEFDNAAWVSGGGGIAVDPDTEVAPDGTMTADTLTASGANGTLIQDLGSVGNFAKSFSIWIKRKTGTGNIDLTMDGGSTWTTVAVTSDWVRLFKTQTITDEDVGIRIVTSGDEVYVWGAQSEQHVGARVRSSYIPTTSSTATRNADYLYYTSSGNLSVTEGTWCVDTETLWTDHLIGATIGTRSGTNLGFMGATVSTRNRLSDGTNTPDATGLPDTTTGRRTRYARYSVAGGITVGDADGGSTSSAFDGDMNSTILAIGARGDGSNNLQWGGTIRNVRIWTVALTDAQIAAL